MDHSIHHAFPVLLSRLSAVADLRAAGNLAAWDQMTGMPASGNAARVEMIGTLARLEHEQMSDPAIGALLGDLRQTEAGLPDGSDEARIIRVARKEHERAARVPSLFRAEMARHFAASHAVWSQARDAGDFALAVPALRRGIELTRAYAEFFPGHAHSGDVILDELDPGVTVASLRPLYAALRPGLKELLGRINEKPRPDASFLRLRFALGAQLAFSRELVANMGFDANRGRIDLSVHPFMARIGAGDVRVATRVRANDLLEAITSTVHEAGHAAYEQGIAAPLERTPLARGASDSLHEGQARMWENVVGRHPKYWEHFFPRLRRKFSKQLGDVTLEEFVRAVNRVEPSFIRAEADEVTYGLHAIMRSEIETALLDGSLDPEEIPDVWRERMREDLGIIPPDDRLGALQDPHWFDTGFMSFQSYVLGDMANAQLLAAALAANPGIPDEFAAGRFNGLNSWFSEHVYRHGAKFTMDEILREATGKPLSADALLNYLSVKYGELYRL